MYICLDSKVHVTCISIPWWSDLIPWRPWKESYAKYISKSGVYLGLADLAIYSMSKKKDLHILFYDNENLGTPQHRPAVEILNQMVNAVGGASLEGFPVPQEAAATSSLAWFIAACNATYNRGDFLSLNHYLPAYARSWYGDDWDAQTKAVQDWYIS